MIQSDVDYSLFYHQSPQGCIYLIVYMNDIFITCSDKKGIVQLKQYLTQKFQTTDLGQLRNFLGIEVHNPRMIWSYLRENMLTTF